MGQFQNPGQTWCQKEEKINDLDFLTGPIGREAQYGVYDTESNEGYVCITMSSVTVDVELDAAIDWWRLNQPNYPQTKRLMIEDDHINAARTRRYQSGWKSSRTTAV